MNYEKMLSENNNCNSCIAIQILMEFGETFVCQACGRQHMKPLMNDAHFRNDEEE